MTRALVLGGGGITGIAWETGVLMGLSESGVDIRGWDLVVGTSAGSVVGAKVLGEPDFNAYFSRQLIEAGPEDDLPIRLVGGRVAATLLRLGRRRGLGWVPSAWLMLFAVETFIRQRVRRYLPPTTDLPPYRRLHGPDPTLRRLGRFGLAARTGSEAVYRKVMAAWLDPVRDWPDRLVVTAIDVETGEGCAFDPSCGVPFLDAIAASCAVPGMMPPVTIGGRAWIDGGMASQTHAHLAAGHDEVVIVAPLDLGALTGEVERLRAGGAQVTVVTPGAESARIIGRHVQLLDPARRARAAQAGLLDGRRAAQRLADEAGPVPAGRRQLARSEG